MAIDVPPRMGMDHWRHRAPRIPGAAPLYSLRGEGHGLLLTSRFFFFLMKSWVASPGSHAITLPETVTWSPERGRNLRNKEHISVGFPSKPTKIHGSLFPFRVNGPFCLPFGSLVAGFRIGGWRPEEVLVPGLEMMPFSRSNDLDGVQLVVSEDQTVVWIGVGGLWDIGRCAIVSNPRHVSHNQNRFG